jgi:predicted DNA-binding transcriptional regulator YafY
MERRLEFIEFRLFWEGHVNRSDLMDTFKVSIAQATTDLNRYLALAPGNMAYDKSAKAYVRTPEFKARFQEPEPGRYLNQLRSVGDGIVEASETWIGHFPAFDAAPTPVRSIGPVVLRSVVAAIRRKEAIEIKYQSLSRPEPRWRWIVPHALGHDGFRWHTRAFCETDRTFKDFLLARMIEVRGTRPAEVDPATDSDWQEQVVLAIGPHPDLSETQQKVVGLDYGMRSGKAKIKVRRAFLYYALKRLGLDTDPAARQPHDQQIVLLNREAVQAVLAGQRDGVRV